MFLKKFKLQTIKKRSKNICQHLVITGHFLIFKLRPFKFGKLKCYPI